MFPQKKHIFAKTHFLVKTIFRQNRKNTFSPKPQNRKFHVLNKTIKLFFSLKLQKKNFAKIVNIYILLKPQNFISSQNHILKYLSFRSLIKINIMKQKIIHILFIKFIWMEMKKKMNISLFR